MKKVINLSVFSERISTWELIMRTRKAREILSEAQRADSPLAIIKETLYTLNHDEAIDHVAGWREYKEFVDCLSEPITPEVFTELDELLGLI